MLSRPAVIAIVCALAMPTLACGQDASTSSGQSYPTKPLRFIAPNLPGGPTDILARLIGQKLTESMGQPVVIENRAGAGGNIGTEVAAKAPPDGYTLLSGNNATFGANPSLYKRLGFDPIKDFTPVVLVATQPNILVVHPSLPVKSVKELIVLARSQPGQLNYAGSGVGTAAHLAAELFKSMTGTNIVHISYKSAGPALTDLIAGQTQLMFATALSVTPHIKSGRVRPLAVTSSRRSRLYSDLPTISEAGVPGFEASTWHGVLVPAGTPSAIVERLNSEINKMLRTTDVNDRITALGGEIAGGSSKEFAEHIRREIVRWGKVVKSIGVQLD
jgi:tripartite-type tricarboxylate transporter receptor subunit TctC